jgi:ATP-dependent DNA helicase RecQ
MDDCGGACDVCSGWDALAAAGELPAGAARARPGRGSAGTGASTAAPDPADPGLADADAELLVRLKALRRQIADERGVPAYIVFPDATLAQMARRRPTTASELLEIPGVGPKKLELYGERFLAELNGRG